MAIPTTIESLSTTAASNGPAGSEQRTLADDGLRQAYAFIAMLVNAGSDIASATTITPPSTGSSFHITGTTAITTIASTNSWNGRLILLIFDGILTFTHGSNLALPGSSNITTAANDIAIMRQNSSGAWRCVAYTRASGALIETTGTSLTLTGDLSVQGNTTLGNGGADTTTTNGNVVLSAPTSGYPFKATGGSGSGVIDLYSPNEGGANLLQITNLNGSLVETFIAHVGAQTNFGNARTDGGGILALYSANNPRITLGAAGNVTVAAPSSGTTLAATAVASGVPYSATDGTKTANLSFATNVTFGPTSAHQLDLRANNTSWLSLTTDGRLYGTALHNNAGAVTGTTNQYIASGTYTPTITNVLNTDSRSGSPSMWTRVGNVVMVCGSMSIDPTAGGTTTQVGISLPIASNFAATTDCSGLATRPVGSANFQIGGIQGDTTNDRADCTFISGSGDTSNNSVFFNFQYVVL